MLQDLFTKMGGVCFKKCIGAKYKDAEMNLGEQTCTDRCVAKYSACVLRCDASCGPAARARLLAEPPL